MSSWRGSDFYNIEEHQDFEDPDPNSSCESSCDSSCCDYHSDCSVPEWNDAVLENGELFFIKCSPFMKESFIDAADPKHNATFKKRYKLSKFLKKRRFKKQRAGNSRSQNHDENCETPKCDNTSDYTDADGQLASVLYLNLVGPEHDNFTPQDDIIYHFPQTADKNVIHSVKGALLTLYHLLPKLVVEDPESSTLLINERLLHLVYVEDERELLIIALPENRCSLFELKQLSSCIVRYLMFRFKSLQECFKNSINYASLNQFFGNLFIKLFTNIVSSSSLTKCDFNVPEISATIQFEDTFGFPSKLNIPHNLEMKIEEEMNEIEANDFGDLSEDHNGCQRLYTIIGTCLYYKGYLIASHLDKEDQLDVHAFLRLNDLLDLTVTSTIESLVIWKEVFISSCCCRVDGLRTFPSNKRWFLSIIGQDQGLFVTLLESGGCSVRTVGVYKPDELYIDEFQETLDDILRFGLADAVDQLMRNNSKTSTLLTNSNQKSADNLSTVISNTNNLTKSSSTLSCESDTFFHHSSPTIDDAYSDTLSRTNSSIFNDESVPVLGRRAQRMKQLSSSGNIYPLHCNLSDSDRSDLDTTGSSHSSSFADMSKKSPKEVHLARQIIHGNNQALFHYVNLHFNTGVIICSLDTHSERNLIYRSILNNFKSYAQKIRGVLSQKKTSNIGRHHRNSLPVKEFGMLFECNEPDDRKRATVYWVVGRMFNKDHLGEIYVCYEDETPQNLVEIAFRLAIAM